MSSNQASKAPPKCNQAITRLERAVLRLERATHSLPKNHPASPGMETDLAEMRQITQAVAERLDHAIGRVRTALEG